MKNFQFLTKKNLKTKLLLKFIKFALIADSTRIGFSFFKCVIKVESKVDIVYF